MRLGTRRQRGGKQRIVVNGTHGGIWAALAFFPALALAVRAAELAAGIQEPWWQFAGLSAVALLVTTPGLFVLASFQRCIHLDTGRGTLEVRPWFGWRRFGRAELGQVRGAVVRPEQGVPGCWRLQLRVRGGQDVDLLHKPTTDQLRAERLARKVNGALSGAGVRTS